LKTYYRQQTEELGCLHRLFQFLSEIIQLIADSDSISCAKWFTTVISQWLLSNRGKQQYLHVFNFRSKYFCRIKS